MSADDWKWAGIIAVAGVAALIYLWMGRRSAR